jgi:hypothetical protein
MVQISYLAIIGIAIAAMFFGYGFGLFEGRNQGYKKGKQEEAAEKKEAPIVEAAQPAPEPVRVKVDDPGLLRIKNEAGAITLDLDGRRVDTMAMTPEQRRRLIEMLNLMRPWLEGKPAAPLSQPASVAEMPQSAPPPTRSSLSASQPAAAKPVVMAKEDRPISPEGSIVTQIDSILQARMAGTPLEDRGVFLTQSPEGGVMVYIGLTKYEGINDVPDSEVKAAIRAAITEWENRFTPGMQK